MRTYQDYMIARRRLPLALDARYLQADRRDAQTMRVLSELWPHWLNRSSYEYAARAWRFIRSIEQGVNFDGNRL